MSRRLPALPNSAPAWQRDAQEHVWLPYAQMQTAAPPLPVVGTDGVRIKLADGRELIDGIAAWWTACHGYNHPHIVDATKQQLSDMPHTMFGGLAHEPAYKLAQRLARIMPGDLDHVFFADSGSVAVEIAMKMAIQYFINRGVEGRRQFISFAGGYHGDTVAAMSVCDPEDGMHRLFNGLLPDQHVVPLPETAEQKQAFRERLNDYGESIAGIIIEPLVQGAGGMCMHAPGVLQFLREVCDEAKILLIADEIFTGFGRTGRMFACEEADIVPDIMCVGKALTGGTVGMAATVARAHVFDAFLSDDPEAALMHGPTYMANPLACAAANASLDLFESEPRLEQIGRIEVQLRAELEPCRGIQGVKDVRVKGAVGAVEVEDLSDADALKKSFVDAGVWLRPFGNVIYLTPSFVMEPDDLSQLTSVIVSVLAARAENKLTAP